MYVNAAFKSDDAQALAFVRARGFGAIVAVDAATPVAAHVPFLTRDEGGAFLIEAHVARPNPLHAILAVAPRVLVIVSGADAYISPDWYVSADQVPTWNYIAVHLTGTACVLPAERTHAHVEALSLTQEARLKPKKPWSTAKMTARRLDAMLAAIVPIEIRIERIEAAFKLSQNKSVADRHETARMLEWRGEPNERGVAAAMRSRLVVPVAK